MPRIWYYVLLALVLIGVVTVVEWITTKIAGIIVAMFPRLF